MAVCPRVWRIRTTIRATIHQFPIKCKARTVPTLTDVARPSVWGQEKSAAAKRPRYHFIPPERYCAGGCMGRKRDTPYCTAMACLYYSFYLQNLVRLGLSSTHTCGEPSRSSTMNVSPDSPARRSISASLPVALSSASRLLILLPCQSSSFFTDCKN